MNTISKLNPAASLRAASASRRAAPASARRPGSPGAAAADGSLAAAARRLRGPVPTATALAPSAIGRAGLGRAGLGRAGLVARAAPAGAPARPEALAEIELPGQRSVDGAVFPLGLAPPHPMSDVKDAVAYVEANRTELLEALREHGALFFRGFPTKTAEHFDAFIKAFGLENFEYMGGAAPRSNVVGNVFTANESPPDKVIPPHHELIQNLSYPSKIAFFCLKAPPSGGETSILHSAELYREALKAEPQLVRDLEAKKLHYVRIIREDDDANSPIGRGWRSTYKANTPEQAAERIRQLGGTYEWLDGGELLKTISPKLPGAGEHEGKKTFFNAAIAVYTGWQDERNNRETAVIFGDGTRLPKAAIENVRDIASRISVNIPWQPGDIMLLDNEAAMHARRSYERKEDRVVYASLIA